jgi:hypothetical protein
LKKLLPYLIALPIAAFGLLTLFLSTSIIFDWFGIRAKEGNYVLFVVWANFICSLLYLFAAYGFIKAKKWTFLLLGLATIVLISTFVIFKIYIYSGGIYETKTVEALIFRTIITLIFVIFAYFTIAKKYKTIKAN